MRKIDFYSYLAKYRNGKMFLQKSPRIHGFFLNLLQSKIQPRPQALSSPERKTLVGSGHMAPRFWVVTNKINVEDVFKIDSCSA